MIHKRDQLRKPIIFPTLTYVYVWVRKLVYYYRLVPSLLHQISSNPLCTHTIRHIFISSQNQYGTLEILRYSHQPIHWLRKSFPDTAPPGHGILDPRWFSIVPETTAKSSPPETTDLLLLSKITPRSQYHPVIFYDGQWCTEPQDNIISKLQVSIILLYIFLNVIIQTPDLFPYSHSSHITFTQCYSQT